MTMYDHLMSSRVFTLKMNNVIQSYEENGHGRDLELAIISHQLRDEK